jgi:integrase
MKAWTPPELAGFLHWADVQDPGLAMGWRLLAATGMRRGEALAPPCCWPPVCRVKVAGRRLGHASATITLTVHQHVHPGMGLQAASRFAALLED